MIKRLTKAIQSTDTIKYNDKTIYCYSSVRIKPTYAESAVKHQQTNLVAVHVCKLKFGTSFFCQKHPNAPAKVLSTTGDTGVTHYMLRAFYYEQQLTWLNQFV